MPHLKDTDMDDLFRRASEKYPLRTDSSDWEKMAAALEKDPTPSPDASEETGERRKRRFFWLFLLLPLAGIGYYFIQQGHRDDATTQPATAPPAVSARNLQPATANERKLQPATANEPALQPANAGGRNVAGANAGGKDATAAKAGKNLANGGEDADAANTRRNSSNAGEKDAAVTNTGRNSANGGGRNAAESNTAGRNAAAVNASARPSVDAGGRTVASGDPAGSKTGAMAGSSGAQKGTPAALAGAGAGAGAGVAASKKAGGTGGQKVAGTQDGPSTANANVQSNNAGEHGAIDPATNPIAASFTMRSTSVDQRLAQVAGPYRIAVDVHAGAFPKDSSRSPVAPKKKQSYFYAGIIGAPDISTVKFQPTKGVGVTFGILLGYAFNDRWAIETGVYVDKKRYYTDGEYFSTKNVVLPSSMELLNVDGTCYMWELPLNARYNFNPAGKTRWFATAGLSTYLMKREKYTYAYKYYNGTRTWDSTWDLKRPSNYPFSIIGLSVGFEQPLGKLGELRVEPYLRIPMTGIGTGSLPILSTGINIGFTKRLW